MPNIALTGQIPLEINHTAVITCTNVSVKYTRPLQVRKGARGIIGKTKGIPDVSGTLTFAVPADRAEFNALALANSGPEGFTLTFSEGLERYMVLGADIGDFTLTNDPGAGNADKQVSFQGTELVQTA